ncbi:Ring domain containing protein [Pandoravirus neocaledonia]|uniref:Ring domain containing protein n=1 Tax=Pandoravirus neocaledonia TaxID=2107708 RepID=A0A2U7UCP4_9VIRU|nr:Ring domain containing protein [Pandoravirus neocaledonia]AVK76162.1 Ring domain containing protein [Pandoravirus neocaledonia]
MDDGALLWPAGPAPTESADTYAACRTGPFVRGPCRRTLWRRDPGPVVACIDVTSDHDIIIECIDNDADLARGDGGQAVSTTTEPRHRHTPLSRRECSATSARSKVQSCHSTLVDDREGDGGTACATASIFGPRLGVEPNQDALKDDDDAEARLVRRRRDGGALTDRAVARAFRRRKRQRQRSELAEMQQEPVPSAPSAALFDWDAFRLSLDDALLPMTPLRAVDALAPTTFADSTLSAPFDLSAAFANIALRSDPPRQTLLSLAAVPMPDAGVAANAVVRPSAPAHPVDADNAKHKPWAAPGDLVLVDREPHGHRTVATVLDFDGARYRVAVTWCDHGVMSPEPTLTLSLTGVCASPSPTSSDHPNARWTNGQLDECAICMDADADAWFGCRCRVPAVCTGCARSIEACPYCDTRLQRPPARIERDLATVAADAPWITVPLRIVLDGVDPGRRAWEMRAQAAWPGVLLKAAIGHMIGRDMDKSRLLVGGRPLADQATLGAQGVSNGRLVCVIPRLRGD